MEYGLIGGKLGHSFSKQIHELLADYTYALCPLETEKDVAELFRARTFKAINVTIPYKQTALALCDRVDDAARAIGAVNTVVNEDGVLVGYNTDFAGCEEALRCAGISLQDKTVLILGSGGTYKTFAAVAKAHGARKVLHASRTASENALAYDALSAHPEIEIILNASPAGMYPNNGGCLVDLQSLPNVCGVFDAVYNPFETRLLWQARTRGIPRANGLVMLVAQAKYACELFLRGVRIPDAEITRVTHILLKQLSNLVLIGMPSSGKTSLGMAAAQALGKDFVDVDTEVERRAGKPIAQIFADEGEGAFRDMESAVCEELGKRNSCVISTGGGSVLRAENVRALAQNGVLVALERPLDQLLVGGARPLSSSADALRKMQAERAPLYRAAADKIVQNQGEFDNALAAVREAFYEAACAQRP